MTTLYDYALQRKIDGVIWRRGRSTLDHMPDWDAAEYVYVQLADELAGLIRDGTYPPGFRLPSEAELAELYEVARPTVRQALSLLRDRGLVVTLHGRGSLVVKPSDS
jgi:GntR family transcriptional regulator